MILFGSEIFETRISLSMSLMVSVRLTVERFVEEGARVVIADIDTEAGEALAAALGDAAAFKPPTSPTPTRCRPSSTPPSSGSEGCT